MDVQTIIEMAGTIGSKITELNRILATVDGRVRYEPVNGESCQPRSGDPDLHGMLAEAQDDLGVSISMARALASKIGVIVDQPKDHSPSCEPMKRSR